MAFIDYYKVLGVEKNATQEEIRKASLGLAIKDTGKRITDAIIEALGNGQ